MKPDKILCFELFGDYAQFKKYFTNMSPTSFSIPPRTVLTGLIGAILGVDKDVNPEHFSYQNSFVALRIINPVKKVRIAHNYLKTDSIKKVYNVAEHKPTNVEFIKDVRYRIYFWHQDETMYRRLKNMLEAHHSIYTICLGISGCIANYSFLGEHFLEPLPYGKKYLVDSVIPATSVQELFFDEPINLQKAIIPTAMKNDREVTNYEEVLFEITGKPMPLSLKDTAYRVSTLQDIIHGF